MAGLAGMAVTAWRAIAMADEVGTVDVSLVAGRMSSVGGSDQADPQIRGQTDRVAPAATHDDAINRWRLRQLQPRPRFCLDANAVAGQSG
jgi:hypothetical protein